MNMNTIIPIILQLQQQALASGNPPFAAVILAGDEVISSCHNTSRSSGNPLLHAELSAIQSAIEKHGPAILQKAHLISSNEPCPMCMGACIWSGIRTLTYFLSQEQVAAIRGWGKFMSAHGIAGADDSGIHVNGPLGNDEMLHMHGTFWAADRNADFKHAIHLSGNTRDTGRW